MVGAVALPSAMAFAIAGAFVAVPAIVGFTAGIGVIIFVGLWKDFLGLTPAPFGLRFRQKLWSLIARVYDRLVGAIESLLSAVVADGMSGTRHDSNQELINIDGPVFFGAAEKLERTLEHIQRPATTLILRMGNVLFVDATGIFAIEEIITDFKRHGAAVFLDEVRPNVRYKLQRAA